MQPSAELTSNIADLHKFIEDAYQSRFLVVDTEGDGKDVRDASANPVTMGVTLTYRHPRTNRISSYYFAFFHIIGQNDTEYFEDVKKLLEKHPCLIFYNAKHDKPALELWDVTVGFYYDLMLMIHLINENLVSYALNSTTAHYGLPQKNKSVQMDRVIQLLGWSHVSVDMMREYSANDGVIEYLLFEKVYPEFCAEGLDGEYWREMMLPWIETVLKMETCGIKINKEFCEEKVKVGEAHLARIIKELDGKVPTKAGDLFELLVKRLGLPVVKRSVKTGKPSFDKQAMKIYEPMLERIKSPVARLVTEYRGWLKVVSTNYKPYLRLVSVDGRLRCNYKLHGTTTRRLSCGQDSDGKNEVKSPNLQNIPRASEKEWDGDLKEAFVPEDEYELWDCDFGQIEMRIGAVYANDEKLLEIFRSGKHLFRTMAAELDWEYHDTKTFVYATNYNAQDERIASIFGIPLAEANKRRMNWLTTYPKINSYKEWVAKQAMSRCYIKYWTGARRHFTNKFEAKHKAFNALIQGGAAEIVKYVAIRVGRRIDWDTCKMLLQVHDSLVFEIRKDKVDYWLPIIKEVMEDVPPQFKNVCPFVVEQKPWGS